MTPLSAFADGEVEVKVNLWDEQNAPIEGLADGDATFEMTRKDGTEDNATATFKVDANGYKIVITGATESVTYNLTEKAAPNGYILGAVMTNEIQIINDKVCVEYNVDGVNRWEPIDRLEFEYQSNTQKIKIPIVKNVNPEAPQETTFKAILYIVNTDGNVSRDSYEATLKIGENDITFNVLKDAFNPVDGEGKLANKFFLEEVNENKTGWEYDETVYRIEPKEGENWVLASLAVKSMNPDNSVQYTEVEGQTLPAKATFTNTYTAPAPSGGGGSHTRYYEVKVNNGKALNFLGDAVTRASSGTVLKAEADPATEGKVFKGWEVVKGGITAENAQSFDFTMPREDVELTAVYEDKPTEIIGTDEPKEPTEPNPDDSVDTEEPGDADEPAESKQPSKETSVPKTGDSMTMELLVFVVLATGAAFGMRKAYHKTK